jgi:methionyl-tRNA formyltransferase
MRARHKRSWPRSRDTARLSQRARTIFLGTGAFAVPIVAALAEHPSVDLLGVITAPSRPGSRGRLIEPPVADWASESGVPTLRPTRLRAADSVAEVAALRPDLLVLADYGQIVPESLLTLPRYGALNLHPSLLPRHRGATPIPAALLAGDEETGVTLMRMDAGLDTGPIVAQRRVAIGAHETAPDLEERLSIEAAALLADALDAWLSGSVQARAQDETEATLTRSLRREDGRADPGRTAAQLEAQVRAFQPWPGTFLDTDSGRVVVWRAHPGVERDPGVSIGALARSSSGGLALAAADRMLELDEVQPAGGRRMTGAELLHGRPSLATAKISAPADRGD